MVSKVFIFILGVPTGLGNPLIATNKLSLATWGSYYQRDHMGPGTYAFGYDIEDPVTGNIQFKQEERHPNGTVTGNYGYVDASGRPHVVTYIADEKGYRATIEIEGEPVTHYPDVQASFRHQQRTSEEGFGANDVANDFPLRGETHPRPPPTYERSVYPPYYEYFLSSGVVE